MTNKKRKREWPDNQIIRDKPKPVEKDDLGVIGLGPGLNPLGDYKMKKKKKVAIL